MARNVFYSFHFANDFWRTQQVRNINALSGQAFVKPNEWETIKRQGDKAIQNWIDNNMKGKSCVVVLIGSDTASRKWVRYEISKAWNEKKAILGIHINKLLDITGQPSAKGESPFSKVSFNDGSGTLDGRVIVKTPEGRNSKETYASIAANIEQWIEEAIASR